MDDLWYQKLSNGETLSYRKAGGQGRPVVFLHGNYSSSVIWEEVMKELKDSFHLYAPDMRGFGKSTYRRKATTLREYAKDVKEFLEALDLKDVLLVGWSAGGGVAMETAVECEDRISHCVLVGSIAPDGYKSKFSLPLQFQQVLRMVPSPFMWLMNAGEVYQRMRDLVPSREIIEDTLRRHIFARPVDPKFLDRMVEAVWDQRNNLDFWEAFSVFNMTDRFSGFQPGSGRLEKIKCPVRIFHGVEDQIVPFFDAKDMKKMIPGSKLTAFKKSGHGLMVDEKDKFIELLYQYGQ